MGLRYHSVLFYGKISDSEIKENITKEIKNLYLFEKISDKYILFHPDSYFSKSDHDLIISDLFEYLTWFNADIDKISKICRVDGCDWFFYTFVLNTKTKKLNESFTKLEDYQITQDDIRKSKQKEYLGKIEKMFNDDFRPSFQEICIDSRKELSSIRKYLSQLKSSIHEIEKELKKEDEIFANN